ncbi:MAG: hypothetical protein ACREAA_19370, partial [Candidatus Polarisedimenticolia bacterium]
RSADAGEDAAWDALASVYAEPLLADVITRWAHRATVTRDPSLSRRVQLWRTTQMASTWTLDPEARRLTRTLSRRLIDHRYTLDGKAISRLELERVLRENPDRAVRRRAWQELSTASADLRTDLVRLIRLRSLRALNTRPKQVSRLIFDAEQLDTSYIHQVVNVLGKRTQPAYDTLLQGMREALGIEGKLEPWDLDHGLEARSRARWGNTAPIDLISDEGMALAARMLQHAGLPAPANTVVRPLPVPSLFAPVSIPADVRVILDPDAGAPEMLEGAARPLLAAHAGQDSAILRGYPWLPTARSVMYDASMASTLEALLHDPLLLREALGLDQRRIDLLIADLRELALLTFRRVLVEEAFEHAVTVNPDADLETRYRQLFTKATGTTIPAGDPVDWPARLLFIEDPLSSLGRLFGPAVAAGVHAKMAKDLGDGRARKGAAGAWLIEHCFKGGERLPMAERLATCTETGHDTKLYFQWMGIGP